MASSVENEIELIAGAAFFGGVLLFSAIKRHRRVRHIQDSPRSKIASAPQGFNEFEGFAWPKEESVKTVSGEEAVYYHFKVQEQRTTGSGKNRRTKWVTVFEETHARPFYIIDPTGIAVIDPIVGEAEICSEKIRNVSSLSHIERNNAEVRCGGTLSTSRNSFLRLLSPGQRICERVILVGSPLYATGDFRAPEAFSNVLVDGGLLSFNQKVFDLQRRQLRDVKHLIGAGKGMFDGSAAVRSYSAAARVARANPVAEASPLQVYGVLTSSETHHLFFADRHEELLVNELGSGIFFRLVGGAALITFAIVFALYRFAGFQL